MITIEAIRKERILIVDDSEMNRVILSAILGDEYEIIEAQDGIEAIELLKTQSEDIDLMLLDIVMPRADGFDVLMVMNAEHYLETVPVIMITAETDPKHIERAYDLGVTDFISRPFDPYVVHRRIINTIILYAKQKKLTRMLAAQFYERERSNNMMIDILSHIVESHNGESGLHVRNIRVITDLLLHRLKSQDERYQTLPEADIQLISMASALHDIGKIGIKSEILNKPGKLTPEEFATMKEHTIIGAEILNSLVGYKDEPLIRTAYEICRWHHERYDGRGYPDGLKGEEIPLAAQVVSIADVYDALTSERCYKNAFTPETAVHMILNGECGAFQPALLECLKDVAGEIENRKEKLGGGYSLTSSQGVYSRRSSN